MSRSTSDSVRITELWSITAPSIRSATGCVPLGTLGAYCAKKKNRDPIDCSSRTFRKRQPNSLCSSWARCWTVLGCGKGL